MKKTIQNLLKKLDDAENFENNGNIASLNDSLSKALKKGGYDKCNDSCAGTTNPSCENIACVGSSNTVCLNRACLI